MTRGPAHWPAWHGRPATNRPRRFNWKQEDDSALTLEEVGQIIGVTKERVRQIQNKALMKIRTVMEEGVLRTRTVPIRESAD